MRKNNNRGFMLIEAIVSGTIVLTSMIVLYSIFNKLYIKYNEKNNYYNIDAVYATKESINYLMKNDFEQNINNIFENSNNYVLIGDNKCQLSNLTIERVFEEESGEGLEDNTIPAKVIKLENINTTFCTKIQELYKVKNMIIAEYDKSTLESLKKSDGDLNKICLDDENCDVAGKNEQIKFNKAMIDYIDYIIGYYGVSKSDTRFSYIVITEIVDGDKHYFANLGIE